MSEFASNLTYEKKTVYEKAGNEIVAKAYEYAKSYMQFLDAAKTEREAVVTSIDMLKKRGCKNIKFMAILGAPEGVSRVAEAHPDVQVFVSTLDRCLNEHGYILPGLGDAGDRLFGTK